MFSRQWGERINRRMFWGATAAISCWTVALSLFVVALAFYGDHSDRDSLFALDFAAVLLLVCWFLIAAFWAVRVVVPRLHDLGAPGWPAALVIPPIIGWFFLAPLGCIVLGIVPGRQSENRFGPVPVGGSWVDWWLALAGFLAVLVLVGIIFALS